LRKDRASRAEQSGSIATEELMCVMEALLYSLLSETREHAQRCESTCDYHSRYLGTHVCVSGRHSVLAANWQTIFMS
jgi:hypothetical protein